MLPGMHLNLQSVVEVILVAGAALLLARDLRRAGTDRLRRPITLLAAALIAALLVGTFGGVQPNPWWLVVPAGVLIWEVIRGWRLTPRCHLWETGVAAFAVSLVLAMAALGLDADALLAASAAACVLAVVLLWRSHLREPHPWRDGDTSHYERRSRPRA